MRRKIVIGLLVQTVLLLAGGHYLANRIGTATTDVNDVVRLHEAAHLRERYLQRLNAVQADLAVEAAGHSNAQAVGHDVECMTKAVDRCFGCHHSDESTRTLEALAGQTHLYRDALDRIAAAPPGSDARRAEVRAAFHLGDRLIAQAADTIAQTSTGLERHTLLAMDDLARAKYVLFAFLAVGPLLSGILGLACISSLTRPLDALVQATRRLKAGDLDHRVEGLRDEFAQLATSFNEMARSLKEQMQLMQRTEQLVVVGELAAGLVHEIKNPLAGVKAAVQVLAREATLSDEDREVLRKVGCEVSGLEALLKSFLGFAKPARPRLDDVDVNALVESVVAFHARTHGERVHAPVDVRTNLGAVPRARLDPLQLQQVLLNLLLNAVEAKPGGATVDVRTGTGNAGAIVIEVADDGRGIAPEHVDRVFRPFFTTKSGGTGLGLAVSKRLVEQQGGSITFRSESGHGTVFRVELPPAAATSAGGSASGSARTA